jgi:hypothetical protein
LLKGALNQYREVRMNKTPTRPELLDIIRLGSYVRDNEIFKGLTVKMKILTKAEVDAANASTSSRMQAEGISPLDVYSRTPLAQEEQLARAVLSWNNIPTSYEQNLDVLRQFQSAMFQIVWNAYQQMASVKELELETLADAIKNSSRNQSPEPSGNSSSDSQTPTGSVESEKDKTSVVG